MKYFLKKIFLNPQTLAYKIANSFLALVTIISILALVLDTVKQLDSFNNLFHIIELVSVGIFTLEYVGRIFADKKPITYVISFWGAIDLLSILPTFFGLGNLTFLKSARLLRTLRFLRMLRIMKVARFQETHEEHDQGAIRRLNIEIYFFALIASVVIFGTLVYVFEAGQANFANIPISMLWAFEILLGGTPQTNVATLAGSFVVVATRFTGLMLFGLLITVIGNVLQKFLSGQEAEGAEADRRNRG